MRTRIYYLLGIFIKKFEVSVNFKTVIADLGAECDFTKKKFPDTQS